MHSGGAGLVLHRDGQAGLPGFPLLPETFEGKGIHHRLGVMESDSGPGRAGASRANATLGRRQPFRTNSFPGNCLMTRFISSPSNATLTAEAGKPLWRMTSSTLVSSRLSVS